MRTLLIEIPDNIKLDEQEAKMILASRLYEKGEITLGHGAEMVGISKREFIERLGDYNVSVFNYSVEDIKDELNKTFNRNL